MSSAFTQKSAELLQRMNLESLVDWDDHRLSCFTDMGNKGQKVCFQVELLDQERDQFAVCTREVIVEPRFGLPGFPELGVISVRVVDQRHARDLHWDLVGLEFEVKHIWMMVFDEGRFVMMMSDRVVTNPPERKTPLLSKRECRAVAYFGAKTETCDDLVDLIGSRLISSLPYDKAVVEGV